MLSLDVMLKSCIDDLNTMSTGNIAHKKGGILFRLQGIRTLLEQNKLDIDLQKCVLIPVHTTQSAGELEPRNP